jgi:biotin carboxyl carrier protein
MSLQIDALSTSWVEFASANDSASFLQGWLDVVCTQSGRTQVAALLIQDRGGSSLVPAAIWPKGKEQDLSRLGDIVQRCLQQSRGLLEPVPDAPQQCRLAYPILMGEQVMGAVVLELTAEARTSTPELKQVHWGLGWLVESMQRASVTQAQQDAQRIGSVMQAMAIALQQRKLKEVLFEIANDTARRLGCARVAIGWVEQESVRLAAMSDAAWLEKGVMLSKTYVAAMEEALDISELIVHPALAQDAPLLPLKQVQEVEAEADAPADTPKPQTPPITPSTPNFAATQHAALLTVQQAKRVVTVPLIQGLDCVALITLEWHGEQDVNAEKLAWLRAYASLLPSVLQDKKDAEKGLLTRGLDSLKNLAAKLFGPGHLLWKTATAIALLLVLIMALVPVSYRVTAKAVLEGQTQRVVAAPFEGFVSSASARAGDVVQAGQVLAQLDDRDLKVEIAKWTSEREQYERRLREAMAAHEMSNVQVYDAQFKQADAQVRLVTEKLARAQITAPYAGIVVSGDLSQMIGSPVEVGKKLFEIAPLEQYRVILQVDEKEVRHVELGQTGQLLVSGVNDEPMDFKVAKLTPVATAQDGKNSFRIEAALSGPPHPRLRPGMEGVGKVSVGSRRLWWVITHSFTDWLRLSLWNWLP